MNLTPARAILLSRTLPVHRSAGAVSAEAPRAAPLLLTPARAMLLARATPQEDHGWQRFEVTVHPAGAVVVARTATASGLSRDTWITTRHAAAVRALEARGLSPAMAWWAAIALMGHWANETGWGRGEFDYALGNIRASGWNGPVHYLQGTDDPVPAPYRAYATLDEGVEDNLRLATGTTRDGSLVSGSRYQPSFLALLQSEPRGPYVVSADGRTETFPLDVMGWHAGLTRAGWHPYSEESQRTFASTVTRVAQAVGAPPAVSAITPARVVGVAAGTGALLGLLWWLWPKR